MRREKEDTRILMRDMFTKERSQKVYHTEKEQNLTKMEILTKERWCTAKNLDKEYIDLLMESPT